METKYVLGGIAVAFAAWLFFARPALTEERETRRVPGSGTATIPPGAPARVRQWRDDAVHAGSKHGVSPLLVLAVIWQESAGVESATGSSGEKGLMQIKKIAARDAGFSGVPWNGRANIFVGTAYLALQIERMGTVYDGLRAYNQGEGGARAGKGHRYAREVLEKAGRTA